MAILSTLSTAFAATVLCAQIASAAPKAPQGFVDIPLTRDDGEIDPVKHLTHAANKHYSYRRAGVANPSLLYDTGFWYGTFNVGNSKNLQLLIDSGSMDIGINPGLYQPSSNSKNLHVQSNNYTYVTQNENGCGQANLTEMGYSDTVTYSGLTAQNQGLYYIQKKTAPKGENSMLFKDGIVGFSQSANDQFGTPFFYNLCQQKQVASCRFGLAFQKNNTGRQILGGIDNTAYTGSLQTFSSTDRWLTTGNIVNNGKTLISNVQINFDSGTAGIVGPTAQVSQFFAAAGVQTVQTSDPGCAGGVFGYYQCNKPPVLGFQFNNGPVWNVDASLIQLKDNGNNNCTIWVTGISTTELQGNYWIIGQNWMQGKYLDFNYSPAGVSIATLKT